MRQCVFGKVEVRVNVGVKCLEPLFPTRSIRPISGRLCSHSVAVIKLGQVRNILHHVLIGSVIDKDVDSSQGRDCLVNNLLAVFLRLDISSKELT